ncbi:MULTISPECIES: UDP-glucose 4-epimerase GalE [Aliiglaciecola]|uniref:UDP-glucose 4-epimerase GalE n=1 Tax=Aliiglaciecola TaxID=1406885 RepID=UPI001C09B898|nr:MULTISPECIES: UDP-glucose 4-epimerase GalE [Aliiglaciecola]MBU2876667.1 UDP-glucose 4-epimerase GalE [Aliiglaciecola lipolytica]MDO6710256.1 UDP-glucose 4-epimerase GalE [Aliiglaciecola sp. 2_MG-2023]MDO6751404.1 UDP-glucose 4-epimerase GalE [Aliiglaciecola sp. 1_MG-2023]
MKVLVTGGAGYIGSHTTLALLKNNFDVVVLDNLTNSNVESLNRVKQLTGKNIDFVHGEIKDTKILDDIFEQHNIRALIHFAALKAVGESSQIPLEYYQNNVYGTLNLLQAMAKHSVNDFIFSSSATVYGEDNSVPYIETMPLGNPTSPYGASKVMVERILGDNAIANTNFRGVSLRYFNPIGAHPSGIIGEDPKGIPNNLLPYLAQVAVGKLANLNVFGNDYATKDGTCERDYLHVMDLAEGHVAALQWLQKNQSFTGLETFNLGTGSAVSVLEIISAFEKVTNTAIPYVIADRRAGDLPAFWANAEKAASVLNWHAKRDLDMMMADTWRWQSTNPNGYSS